MNDSNLKNKEYSAPEFEVLELSATIYTATVISSPGVEMPTDWDDLNMPIEDLE